MQRHTIVEPVSKGRTDDQELLEKTSDAATDFSGAVLSDVDGCDAGHATNTETSNETTDIDLADVVERRDLDNCADEEDECESQERFLATKPIVGKRGEDCTEEAACCEQGNNILGDMGVCLAGESGGRKGQVEVNLEALERENRAHNTSVITYSRNMS